ncbi:hypothetical protein [Chelatococcus composti]|jgi:hypothetical protein|uniref:Uncharacterized protein n=1 Tax=Chelatococcus composti TaxID=1743235 RepID=A0A841K300_9HYPH|nr:hypothetical protein [Chelatococcus composti]MBB6167128.1 hypothetical protein [Chelatococcus composti]MBS7735337.1 hypothetical protein [Chelatococcus composti]GGG29443.1 hypothetical protein GCM10008026_07440 [Chelatococcus composti]
MGNAFSGSSQRRMMIAQQIQEEQRLAQQRAEIERQRREAEEAQAGAMQALLARDTNRLLRTFGARSIATAAR